MSEEIEKRPGETESDHALRVFLAAKKELGHEGGPVSGFEAFLIGRVLKILAKRMR